MKALRGSVIVVLCAGVAACGSGTKQTAITCSSVTACGGDVVGTWRLVSSCASSSSPACTSSEKITGQLTVTLATFTFAAGGTFTAMASGQVNDELRYPLACLGAVTDAGIPQACADVERTFVPDTQDAGAGAAELASARCAAAANDSCACTLVIRYTTPLTGTGSYTISGSRITITESVPSGAGQDASTDVVTDHEYCVSGNTLMLHSFDNGSDTVMTLTR